MSKPIIEYDQIHHIANPNYQSTYLVIIPVPSTSIFLKRAVEKNDGSLQISLVTGLNSGIAKPRM